MGTRRPLLCHPLPQKIRRSGTTCRRPSPLTRPLPSRNHIDPPTRTQRKQHRCRSQRPTKTLLVDLPKNGHARQRLRRNLRPGGHTNPRRQPQQLLRSHRGGALPIRSHARPIQRLHFLPKIRGVPIAPHHSHGRRRQTTRSTGPHPRNARQRGIRHCRPLAVQRNQRKPLRGTSRNRPNGVDAPTLGLAERSSRPQRIPRLPPLRPKQQTNLRVHPQRGCGEPAR